MFIPIGEMRVNVNNKVNKTPGVLPENVSNNVFKDASNKFKAERGGYEVLDNLDRYFTQNPGMFSKEEQKELKDKLTGHSINGFKTPGDITDTLSDADANVAADFGGTDNSYFNRKTEDHSVVARYIRANPNWNKTHKEYSRREKEAEYLGSHPLLDPRTFVDVVTGLGTPEGVAGIVGTTALPVVGFGSTLLGKAGAAAANGALQGGMFTLTGEVSNFNRNVKHKGTNAAIVDAVTEVGTSAIFGAALGEVFGLGGYAKDIHNHPLLDAESDTSKAVRYTDFEGKANKLNVLQVSKDAEPVVKENLKEIRKEQVAPAIEEMVDNIVETLAHEGEPVNIEQIVKDVVKPWHDQINTDVEKEVLDLNFNSERTYVPGADETTKSDKERKKMEEELNRVEKEIEELKPKEETKETKETSAKIEDDPETLKANEEKLKELNDKAKKLNDKMENLKGKSNLMRDIEEIKENPDKFDILQEQGKERDNSIESLTNGVFVNVISDSKHLLKRLVELPRKFSKYTPEDKSTLSDILSKELTSDTGGVIVKVKGDGIFSTRNLRGEDTNEALLERLKNKVDADEFNRIEKELNKKIETTVKFNKISEGVEELRNIPNNTDGVYEYYTTLLGKRTNGTVLRKIFGRTDTEGIVKAGGYTDKAKARRRFDALLERDKMALTKTQLAVKKAVGTYKELTIMQMLGNVGLTAEAGDFAGISARHSLTAGVRSIASVLKTIIKPGEEAKLLRDLEEVGQGGVLTKTITEKELEDAERSLLKTGVDFLLNKVNQLKKIQLTNIVTLRRLIAKNPSKALPHTKFTSKELELIKKAVDKGSGLINYNKLSNDLVYKIEQASYKHERAALVLPSKWASLITSSGKTKGSIPHSIVNLLWTFKQSPLVGSLLMINTLKEASTIGKAGIMYRRVVATALIGTVIYTIKSWMKGEDPDYSLTTNNILNFIVQGTGLEFIGDILKSAFGGFSSSSMFMPTVAAQGMDIATGNYKHFTPNVGYIFKKKKKKYKYKHKRSK